MEEKNSVELKESDIFLFPKEIFYKVLGDNTLVISTNTANWIVINSEKEKKILELLIDRNSIGNVILKLNKDDKIILKNLIAKICARKFAGINEEIEPTKIITSNLMYCYLTNSCNLRCPHCYMKAGEKMKNELSCDDWKDLLTDFKNEGGKGVTFTGGEPLMNKSFGEIVKHAHNIGLEVTVLTNGILWDEEKINSLYPYITEIQISIDGFDDKSNSVLRGINHFEHVKNVAISFANLGVKTSIATTFTFENLKDGIEEKYKYFVDSVSEKVKNPIIFRLSKKMLSGREIKYTEEQNKEYYEKVLKIENYVRPNSTLYNFMEDHHNHNLLFDNCGFGGISISSDGNVFLCNRILDLKSIGNIKDYPIKHFIEYGEKVNENTSVNFSVPCNKCHLRYICGGGCRLDDFNFKGDLEKAKCEEKQISCSKIKKEKIERLMLESFKYYYNFNN